MTREAKEEENTEGQGDQEVPAGFEKESGGFDTLTLTIYGGWHPEKFTAFQTEVSKAQQAARDHDSESALVQFGEATLAVQPGGAKAGGGYARFLLEADGVWLKITERVEENEHRGNIFVQIGSIPLMVSGLRAVLKWLNQILEAFGFTPSRIVVGRVDVCVDLVGVTVADFAKLTENDQYVTRAADYTHRKHNRESSSIEVGNRERVFLRIYDKLLETERDELKRSIMVIKRWGCLPESAVRVEFQLASCVVRALEISTPEELFDRLASLVEFCVSEWFRIIDNPADRKNRNQSRQGLHPLWARVQDAFAEWAGRTFEPVKLIKSETYAGRTSRLLKQALGCLASAMAHKFTFGPNGTLWPQGFQFLFDLIEERGRDVYNAARARAAHLQVSFGSAFEGVADTGQNPQIEPVPF